MEHRKYFNISKESIEKSALSLWHYCDWTGKPRKNSFKNYIQARPDFAKLQYWRILRAEGLVHLFQTLLTHNSTNEFIEEKSNPFTRVNLDERILCTGFYYNHFSNSKFFNHSQSPIVKAESITNK